jgi:acylphosphatase
VTGENQTMPTRRFLVEGRVQGVGFRAFCQQTARHLQLDGWVRNVNHHQVEVMARGSEAALAQLEQSLHRGPALSRVDQVTSWLHTDQSVSEGFFVRPTYHS